MFTFQEVSVSPTTNQDNPSRLDEELKESIDEDDVGVLVEREKTVNDLRN